MAIKRCPWCRAENPGIYEHCIKCGGPLPEPVKPEGAKKYLLPALLLIAIVVIVIFLVVPALHLSVATGRNLSTAISSGSVSLPQYEIGQPAQYGDLQVAVTQVRTGGETVNNGRFLTVTVSIRNLNTKSPVTIGAGDFILTDKSGDYYSSTGIGSKVSYEAQPGSAGIADLIYFVPTNEEADQVLFMFPDTSGTVTGRHEVAFNL